MLKCKVQSDNIDMNIKILTWRCSLDLQFFPLITEEELKLPLYLKSIGMWDNQEHVNRPQGYMNFQWLHCVNGKGELIIEGKEYILAEGMGFFFHPGIRHEYYSLAKSWTTHWISFDGIAIPVLLERPKTLSLRK